MDKRHIASGIAAAIVLGALGFVVAGCGSSSAAPPTTTTTTTTAGGSAAGGSTAGGSAFAADFQKFQSCLKSHGVTIKLPQFNGRPPGGGTRTFTGPRPTTTNGTGTTRRFGGGGGFNGGGFASRLGNLTAAQRKAVTACQSSLPQGRFGGFGGGTRRTGANGGAFAKYTQCLSKHGVKFGQSSQNSTAFRKAQTACRSLLPAPTTTTTG